MTEMTDRAVGAGYSGTPLAKKLGVKPGHRVLLMHAPARWTIPGLPPEVQVSRRAAPPPDAAAIAADVIAVFCRSRRQLQRDLVDLAARLPATGSLWIAWPRRAAGHPSDITENGLRELLLPVGVVDVKVAALDHDWSGLKFVWRKAMPKQPAGSDWSSARRPGYPHARASGPARLRHRLLRSGGCGGDRTIGR
jgi:hypothetical protein